MNGDECRVLPRLRDVLCRREGLIAAYLFGSRADGSATEASDFDIAVLFGRPLPLQEQLRLEDELALELGRTVDLVDLRTADPFLALAILRGTRFLVQDPVAADEYELYVLRRAGDLEMLERERRALLLEAK